MQLKCVREDYQKFGKAARIDAEAMKIITDHVSTSEEVMVEVCELWMQKCWQKKVTPSWSGVAEILTRIGRKDLAKQIVKVCVQIQFLVWGKKITGHQVRNLGRNWGPLKSDLRN